VNGIYRIGDFVLTDTEANPAMAKLISGGIEITALHNHLPHKHPAADTRHKSPSMLQIHYERRVADLAVRPGDNSRAVAGIPSRRLLAPPRPCVARDRQDLKGQRKA